MPYIDARCPTCGSNLLALDVAPVEICVVCERDCTDIQGSGRVVANPEINHYEESLCPETYDEEV